MIDSKCAGPYQRLIIDPLLRCRWVRGHNPHMLTLIGLFLGLLVPFCLAAKLTTWALLCLMFSGFFDTLDGALARYQKTACQAGAALDITADRIVEGALIFGLYLYEPATRGTSCLLMLSSILICITTFLVVGIFMPNDSEKSFHYSSGLIERAEALLLLGAMILFPGAFLFLSTGFSLLVSLTGGIRLWEFLSLSHKADPQHK